MDQGNLCSMLLLGQNVFCFLFCFVLTCLFLLQPLTRQQKANRNRSSINMKNFKKFNARRKWRVHHMCIHIYIYFFAHVMLFLSYFIFEVCFRYVQMSYNMVWICNRLVRLKLLCKGSSDAPEVKINTLSSHFIRYTWTCPPHPVYER